MQRRSYLAWLGFRGSPGSSVGVAAPEAPRPAAVAAADAAADVPRWSGAAEAPAAAVDRAIARCHDYFRGAQYPEGCWWGELESNNTMEAEYLLLARFLGKVDPERQRKMANHILRRQRADGSWGQYYQAPGDLSTSVECYFALKLSGLSADAEPLRRARRFILAQGGVPKARIFTKIWLALFGQWDWRGLPNMPPEMVLLPRWAPFNIYHFSSWARATIVPLLIVFTRRPVCPLPPEAGLDELYPGPRPRRGGPLPGTNGGLARLFRVLDRLVGLYRDLPFHPLRRTAERRVVEWIVQHQEADGSWGGIQPPWVYSLIALHVMGFPADHPAMRRGWDGFDNGYIIEDEDTCSLQGCISPVWDTCLVHIALAESGMPASDPALRRSGAWLLGKQVTVGGDWQVRARRTPPGGWPFEFHNNWYPDIDDTAEVVMALALTPGAAGEDPARRRAMTLAEAWLLGMQSRNGGWASFDKDNTRRYVTRLPFCDFGELLDPPSADVTAHVLEMFGRLGYPRSFPPLARAYRYLRREQEPDGSWFGRWGVNYIYGLGAVLPALEAIGEDMTQPYVRRAVAWLMTHQNPDGGWGESCASYVDSQWRGRGPSTASQTAWALLALLAAGEARHPVTRRGIRYLLDTQTGGGSWDEPYFTGTGFPGYGIGERVKRLPKPGERGHQGADMPAGFMINYHMYRNCWPLLALGRYRRLAAGGRRNDRTAAGQNGPARLYIPR
jgi:squalene-hopene/tetraprenyl-beta-curcumene cyclase